MNAWDRLYHQLIVALVQSMPGMGATGLCHMAAEIADAAFAERRTRGAIQRTIGDPGSREVAP